MQGRRRNRSEGRKLRPGSARERGNVWVPVDGDLNGQSQYWNKYIMTKTDTMFLEMEKKFQNLAVRRRSLDQSKLFSSPSETANRGRRSRHSDYGTLTRPYPSGSCHTVVAGNNSTFCITSNINSHSNAMRGR